MSAKKQQPKSEPLDFEQALQQLETLIETLERTDISLADSLSAFESGITLTRLAQKSLSEAEQKIQVLINQNDEIAISEFTEDASQE